MQLSEKEITELRAARPDRGWPEVPTDCPVRIARGICETRAKMLAGKVQQRTVKAAPATDPSVDALRQRLAEIRL